MRAGALALALALAAACLIFVSPASGTFPGRNGLLVHRDGQRLWVERPNGSYRRELLNLYGANEPRWSPDGRRVVFTAPTRYARDDLFVIRADGSHLRRLTRTPIDDSSPAWSPNGRRIAFASGRRLTVIGVDGSDARGLAELGYYRSFDWAPSGLIAYAAPDDDLYVADAGGGSRVRVLDEPPDGEEHVYDLNWSPSGRWIMVTLALGGMCDFCTRLAKVRPDGTDYTPFRGKLAFGSLHPTWSPDGRSIRFCHLDGDGYYYPSFETISMRPDGTHRRMVRRADCGGDWQARAPKHDG